MRRVSDEAARLIADDIEWRVRQRASDYVECLECGQPVFSLGEGGETFARKALSLLRWPPEGGQAE